MRLLPGEPPTVQLRVQHPEHRIDRELKAEGDGEVLQRNAGFEFDDDAPKGEARTTYDNVMYLERPGCNLCMGNQEKAEKGDTVMATSTRLFHRSARGRSKKSTIAPLGSASEPEAWAAASTVVTSCDVPDSRRRPVIGHTRPATCPYPRASAAAVDFHRQEVQEWRVDGLSEPRVLRWALVGRLNPEGLQPYADLDLSHATICRHIFETPLGSSNGGLLAVTETLPNGTLRTRLRSDARLSDGTPLDAATVAKELSASPWIAQRATIAVDGDGVSFKPRGGPFDLTPLLRDGRVRFGVQRSGEWIGSGLYRVASWSASGVDLEANPHSDQQVGIRHVRCIGYGGRNALDDIRADLMAGRIDFTEALGREALEGVRGCRKLFGHAQSTALLWFNTMRVDKASRVAIAGAIDRIRTLSTTYANPLAFVARSVLPSGMARVRMPEPREFGARHTSLSELRRKNPLRMVVIWARRPYIPDPFAWAKDIVAQLRDVDIEVSILQSDSAEDYQRRLESGEYDMVLGGWNATSPSPGEFFDALLSSSMLPAGVSTTGCNFSRVQDPAVDALLQQFRSSPSEENERKVVEYLETNVPVVPLGYASKAVCASWDVGGVEDDHGFMVDLSQLRWDSALRRTVAQSSAQ